MRVVTQLYLTLIYLTLIFLSSIAHAGVLFSNTNARVSLNSGAHMTVQNPIAGWRGVLRKKPGAQLTGATIFFTEGLLDEKGNAASTISPDAGNALSMSGDAEMIDLRGIVSQTITVTGANNKIEGTAVIKNDVVLTDATSTVTINLKNRLESNVQLQGGTMSLEDDLKFADSKRVLGPGKLSLNGHTISFGAKNLTWNESLYFDNAADVDLNAALSLAQTWTFGGYSILNGNGNILTLGTNGTIVVDSGATLLIKDTIFQGVSGNKIKCITDQSNLILQNVGWIQDGDYTFTKGALQILDDVIMRGEYTFAYQTVATSTVNTYSKLILDEGFTFSYDPLTTSSQLLYFVDKTAQLHLNGATLHTTTTSLILTRGTLQVAGASFIASEEYSGHAGRIILGDGISSRDMVCKVLSGANLKLSTGSLNYRNVNASSWQMTNQSSVLELGDATNLYLYETLDTSVGVVLANHGVIFYRLPTTDIIGGINARGIISFQEIT